MAITPRFDRLAVKKVIDEKLQKFHQLVVSEFAAVGIEFITAARQLGQYQNQSYNLRSSIACAVVHNGAVAFEDFKQFGNGIEGVEKARIQIGILAKKFGRGYALVVVAGEEYAIAVESRGFDVLTGSSLLAKTELRKAIQRIRNKV